MLCFLLTLLIISSVTYAVSFGDTHALSQAAMDGGSHAITLFLTLSAAMALWGGVMNIAKHCGVTQAVTLIVKRPLSLLFHNIDKSVTESISANVTANLLGLGNAAFPTGIAAAKQLSRQGASLRTKTFFLVLNTASIQLIPLTTAKMRGQHGAADIWDCTVPTLIVSAGALAAGLLTAAAICPNKRTYENIILPKDGERTPDGTCHASDTRRRAALRTDTQN